MKTCTLCFCEQDLSCFSLKNKAKGKYMSYCKACSNEYHRRHYLRNGEKYRRLRDVYRLKTDTQNKKNLVEYLLSHPCVDCKESDIRVLEFDHIGIKKFNVSCLLADSARWERIATEISQCEVCCANCHKKRTSVTFGWYRNNVFGAIV